MGRRIITTHNGHPLNLDRLRDIQNIFNNINLTLKNLLGVEPAILSGLQLIEQVNGLERYTPGHIFWNSLQIPYTEEGDNFYDPSNPNSKLCIYRTVINALHDNTQGTTSPIKEIFTAKFGQTTDVGCVAGFRMSEFVRVKSIYELSEFSMPDGVVVDPNYLAFTQSMLDKLNGIQQGAQVNVKPSWTAAPGSANEILDKPTILNVLANETYIIGDFGNADYEVPLVPAVSTADYKVICSFETAASNASATVDFNHIVHSKTFNSFKIRLKEPGNISQALTINYLIIAN